MSTAIIEASSQSSDQGVISDGLASLDRLAAVSAGSYHVSGLDMNTQALKTAARLNASKTTAQEHNALLNERRMLLQRKYEARLTEEDANRLEYVRWSLDRIEDAKYGQEIDQLEDAVARYKRALHDLQHLQGTLNHYLPGKRR